MHPKWLWLVTKNNLSLLDNARICLVGCIIQKRIIPKKICSNAQDPEMLDLWDLGYLANHIRCNNSLKVFLFLIRFLAIKKSIVRCITSVAIIASIKSISSCFFSLVTFSFLVTSYKNMWICNSYFWRMCQILCTYWIEIVS